MTPAELEAEARALYDECPTAKPAWGDLGETTKSVWYGYVLSGMSGGVLLA